MIQGFYHPYPPEGAAPLRAIGNTCTGGRRSNTAEAHTDKPMLFKGEHVVQYRMVEPFPDKPAESDGPAAHKNRERTRRTCSGSQSPVLNLKFFYGVRCPPCYDLESLNAPFFSFLQQSLVLIGGSRDPPELGYLCVCVCVCVAWRDPN